MQDDDEDADLDALYDEDSDDELKRQEKGQSSPSGAFPTDDEGLMKLLNMGDYDEEEAGTRMFLSGHKLMYHAGNEDDPYVTVPEDVLQDEDMEDMVINSKTDRVFVAGHTEEEHSSLEVHVYDTVEQTTYVHHDLMIPSFPLCVQWMNFGMVLDSEKLAAMPEVSDVSQLPYKPTRGNFCAVGTFLPGIEIWNLDVINAIEPVCTLGGHAGPSAEAQAPPEPQKMGKKNKKKKKKKGKESRALADQMLGELKPGSHTDAVLSLNWHPKVQERLASGSADSSVKLWDVSRQTCVQTYKHHSSKVQALQWNPAESSVLLTGSFDGAVGLLDTRQSLEDLRKPGWKVDSDIECLQWNPHRASEFAVSTESGHVHWFDARKLGGAPLFTLEAHQAPTTGFAFSPGLPGVFATCSVDKTVKLWRQDPQTRAPQCLRTAADMQIGKAFCLTFDRDDPYLLVAGGSKGKVALWDTRDTLAPEEHKKLQEQRAALQPPVPDESAEGGGHRRKPQMSLEQKQAIKSNIKNSQKKRKATKKRR